MDFNDTPEEAAFRAEARAFLAANAELKGRARPVLRLGDLGADAVQRCKDWQAKKADAGFAGITWPKHFGGREASPILQVIYSQEEDNYAVPRGLFEIGLGMCIPTMMAYAQAGTARSLRATGAARRGGMVPVVLASRRAGPIWPRCARGRSATAMTGSSTGRRSGPQARICRTSASSSCAPIRTCRNTKA